MADYDLVVIGSGPGGQRAAVQAAKLKKRVLVVERGKIGGNCVHTGTIPSKTLREAAIADRTRDGQVLPRVMKRVEEVLERETSVMMNQLQRNKVEFARGVAKFVGPREVEIAPVESGAPARRVSTEFFVVATGTSPIHPPKFPFNEPNVYDSDTVLRMTSLPSRLAVIGAGVIGCEYASIFRRLGVRVTLIDRRRELLRLMDPDVIDLLGQRLKEDGVELLLGTDMGGVEKVKDSYGVDAVRIQVGPTGSDQWRYFRAVLVCMGRSGNTEGLGLESAGVKVDERGVISVNADYQTSNPNVYAVGDVIGHPALAASSGEQGRLAACHAFGHDGGRFPDAFPYGIYTIPEISCVGAQEADLKEKGIPYVVGRARYNELARGQIMDEHHGLLKLIVGRDDQRVLGVHIIGSGATELVHIGQIIIATGGKVRLLVQNVFNYPTLAEAYKVAAYNAMNQF